jgi:hypothetical protein
MTSVAPDRRPADAARAAASRADGVRVRIKEIEERLSDLRAVRLAGGPGEDHVRTAEHQAAQAVEHRAASARRAKRAGQASVAAYESAALAHERAATAHERAAETGVGNVETHAELSARHRRQASADRSAGLREKAALELEFPDDS